MPRIFGDENAVDDKIAEVTQGIGLEQVPVQNSSAPGATRVELVEIGSFETTTTQNPTGQGDAGKITINYGAGGSTSGGEFTVNANGVTDVNAPAAGIQYNYMVGLRIGRTGAPGVAVPLLRFMYAADGIIGNAVQVGGSYSVEIDDGNTIWREAFDLDFTPAVGSLFFVEMARDESGNNSGGLIARQPTGTIASWNPVSVARISIRRRDVI